MKKYNTTDIRSLEEEFSFRKTFPEAYKEVILVALSHFPELQKVFINFKVRKTRANFLITQFPLRNVLLSREKQAFDVIIQERSATNKISLKDLSGEAQIGAIARELALIKLSGTLKLTLFGRDIFPFLHIRRHKSVELKIDKTVIEHGLATQLFEYAKHIRNMATHDPLFHIPELPPEKIVLMQNQQLGL